MPRLSRIVMEGLPHHVTQRGNRKEAIFLDDVDRRTYLRLLRERCTAFGVRIWAYTLMTNHVHLIAVPDSRESLGAALGGAHGDYASYFNKRHGTVGHAWQGRFKSSVLDDRHLRNAVRYVERNPVSAGMVPRAEDYLWSSAAAHCGHREDPLLSSEILALLEEVQDWSTWLKAEVGAEDLKILRDRTRTGRPCGGDEFVRRLEKSLGRPLKIQKPGPKKSLIPDLGGNLFQSSGVE